MHIILDISHSFHHKRNRLFEVSTYIKWFETVDNQMRIKPQASTHTPACGCVTLLCRWVQHHFTAQFYSFSAKFNKTTSHDGRAFTPFALWGLKLELFSLLVGEVISRELQTKNKTENLHQCCKTSTTTGVVRKALSSAHALSSTRWALYEHLSEATPSTPVIVTHWGNAGLSATASLVLTAAAFALIWRCQGLKLRESIRSENKVLIHGWWWICCLVY